MLRPRRLRHERKVGRPPFYPARTAGRLPNFEEFRALGITALQRLAKDSMRAGAELRVRLHNGPGIRGGTRMELVITEWVEEAEGR